MQRKPIVILPLASALGALVGTVALTPEAGANVPTDPAGSENSAEQNSLRPNILVSTGETLLGFVVTDQPDGTIVAQHASHESHASHASHASHTSSR